MALDVAPARRIQRFELLEKLGAGGMGVVYRARDPQLGREVAIKLLRPPDHAMPGLDGETLDLRKRSRDDLLAEARVMAQLAHPNVLPIFELGRDGDAVFFVVELVAGPNLRAWLETRHTVAMTIDVLAQAAAGLAAAHEHGIVHRDFKPDNVLIGRDARVRVADFGLSELVLSRAGSMVRTGAAHGTPWYLAPELKRGARATFASDVFAFCVTAVEAITGDAICDPVAAARSLAHQGVAGPVRAAIVAGLASSPTDRPTAAVLAGLLRRRKRRTWPLVAASVAAAVLGIGASFGRAGEPARPSCGDDRSILAGRWDDERRAQLQAILARKPAFGGDELARRVIADLDTRAAQIVGARHSVCEASRRGELGGASEAIRASCWERRAFDLGATVRSLLAHPERSIAVDVERAQGGFNAPWCDVAVTPPLLGDRTAASALHDRLVDIFDLPGTEQVAPLVTLEDQARRIGEQELAVRAAFFITGRLLIARDYAAAEIAASRAYRGAQALRIDDLAARALVQRSTIATQQADPERAAALIDVALVLIDHPAVGTRARIDTLIAAAARAVDRGDHAIAADLARRGLDELARGPLYAPAAEIRLRGLLMIAFDKQGRTADAFAAARENVARAKAVYGARSYFYGTALAGLAMLELQHQPGAAANATQNEAFAVLAASKDPGRPPTELACMKQVYELEHGGSFEETYRACSAAHASCLESGEAAKCSSFLGPMAEGARGLGRPDEAIRLLERALGEISATAGIDHAAVTELTVLAELELELDRSDAAERRLAAIERAYASRLRPTPRELAKLRGVLAATLALARGRATEAEPLARDAVARLGGLADGVTESSVLRVLGASLVAQRRWVEAREVLKQAYDLARSAHARNDAVAAIEAVLAAAELGSGDRTGLARARHARDVLADYPGQIHARREVAALLAREGAGPRPGGD